MRVQDGDQELLNWFWLTNIWDPCIISLDLLSCWGAHVDKSGAAITLGMETMVLQFGGGKKDRPEGQLTSHQATISAAALNPCASWPQQPSRARHPNLHAVFAASTTSWRRLPLRFCQLGGPLLHCCQLRGRIAATWGFSTPSLSAWVFSVSPLPINGCPHHLSDPRSRDQGLLLLAVQPWQPGRPPWSGLGNYISLPNTSGTLPCLKRLFSCTPQFHELPSLSELVVVLGPSPMLSNISPLFFHASLPQYFLMHCNNYIDEQETHATIA